MKLYYEQQPEGHARSLDDAWNHGTRDYSQATVYWMICCLPCSRLQSWFSRAQSGALHLLQPWTPCTIIIEFIGPHPAPSSTLAPQKQLD
jgi:hypothetical protein